MSNLKHYMKPLLSEYVMSKFVFSSTCEGIVTTKEFEEDYLFNVIERFEEFLRGSGFYFNGHLDIVNDDEMDEPIIDDSFDFTEKTLFSEK